MENAPVSNERIKAIDSFRGIVVIAMVTVNFIRDLAWIPSFLKHAEPGGVTFVDIIAPAFIFMIGLTYRKSFNKRKGMLGRQAAVSHVIQRSLSLIGIEVLFYLYVQLFFGHREQVVWNTLSVIGFVILVSLPFLNFPSPVKLAVGCALILFHQLLPLARYGLAIYSIAGGAYSLAGWSSVIFLGLFMADLFFRKPEDRRRLPYAAAGLLMLIIGIVSGRWYPYIRRGMSLSLCFLSIGVSSLTFYLMYLLEERLPMGYFAAWGRNPLVIFIVSIMFIPFNIANIHRPVFTEPNLLMLLYFAGYMALLQLIVLQLDRRKIILKF